MVTNILYKTKLDFRNYNKCMLSHNIVLALSVKQQSKPTGKYIQMFINVNVSYFVSVN